MAATTSRRRCPLTCLLVATITGTSHSYAPSRSNNAPLVCVVRTSTSSLSARLPPGGGSGSNWEDDFSSSRNDGGVSGDKAVIKPAWQENAEYWAKREELERLNKSAGKGISGGGNDAEYADYGNDGGNTFARMYQPKSTDEFKKPYDPDDESNDTFAPNHPPPRPVKRENPPLNAADGDPPAWFGSNERIPDSGERNVVQTSAKAPTNPNENRHNFQMSSTDDFRKPHGSAPGISGGGHQQRYSPPPQATAPVAKAPVAKSFNPDTNRHSFQTSSTDDFRKPYGMQGVEQEQQQRPRPRVNQFKAPFQTSTTDDFKRSSDVATGASAPQQPVYQQKTNERSANPAWRNGVGRDTYGSTLSPPPGFQELVGHAQKFGEDAANAFRSMQPTKFMDAMIVDNNPLQPSQPAAPVVSGSAAPMTDFQEWDRKMETASAKSRSMMIRPIKWPSTRNLPGVSADHPALAMRVLTTLFATLTTRYLHLYTGYSAVLASSVTTLLVSMCVDSRLGQAALCGSLAGMSGGHLAPTVSVALALGAATSVCYELLININDLCLGIGGRLGATAFLATSIVAKHQRIRGVGRRLRRGMWSGAGLSNIATTMILFHALGAVATILLRESSDNSGAADPVRASSVVGLLGSLFLREPMAALALYGGSFVGMSTPSRLMDGSVPGDARAGRPRTAASLVASFAVAGAMAGLIHAMSVHNGYWNGGWGGKVGLCAFAGCWAHRGFGNVARFIKRRT